MNILRRVVSTSERSKTMARLMKNFPKLISTSREYNFEPTAIFTRHSPVRRGVCRDSVCINKNSRGG